MKINSIKYQNYRNIGSMFLEFSPGVNVLWGMNGQGKSNILEGIYYFARGRSFKGAKDRELVMFNTPFARSEIEFARSGAVNPTTLSITIPSDGKKKIMRGKTQLSGPAEMLGSFRAVLFSPAHLSLVQGTPAERRNFLDIAISQTCPEYISALAMYKKYLAERNALIKDFYTRGLSSRSPVWETYAELLSNYGIFILNKRRDYCEKLNESMTMYFDRIADGHEWPRLDYCTHTVDPDPRMCDDPTSYSEELFFRRLTENVLKEVKAGHTLWGPHRDDIDIVLNGRLAKNFASQGQCRTLALCMKLAEGEISSEVTGEYPVFLLDDVFSELDETRRDFIMNELYGMQIIITSCEPSVIPSNFSDAVYFEVSDGRAARS